MKVLHLTGATEDIGGILTVLRNLQCAGEGRGVRHSVWVNEAYRETRQPALDYRRCRHLIDESRSHVRLLSRAPLALVELRRLLRRESFDVLHAHTRGALPLALGVAAVLRWPVIYSSHAFASRKRMYRWAARQPRLRFTVLTPNMARHYGFRLGQDRVTVVSECCSDRFFAAPLVPRRDLGRASSPVRFVGLGNIVSWKNWHLMVEAIAGLELADRQRVQFHHWGPVPSGPECARYDSELRARIARHRLEGICQLHGLSLAVDEVLRDADYFILPSTNEPCSVALIEALALGLPAIASASGGNVDIVRHGATGWLFEPENAASLGACLRDIVRGSRPGASSEEIRESVRQRSPSAVAAGYGAIYEEMRL